MSTDLNGRILCCRFFAVVLSLSLLAHLPITCADPGISNPYPVDVEYCKVVSEGGWFAFLVSYNPHGPENVTGIDMIEIHLILPKGFVVVKGALSNQWIETPTTTFFLNSTKFVYVILRKGESVTWVIQAPQENESWNHYSIQVLVTIPAILGYPGGPEGGPHNSSASYDIWVLKMTPGVPQPYPQAIIDWTVPPPPIVLFDEWFKVEEDLRSSQLAVKALFVMMLLVLFVVFILVPIGRRERKAKVPPHPPACSDDEKKCALQDHTHARATRSEAYYLLFFA